MSVTSTIAQRSHVFHVVTTTRFHHCLRSALMFAVLATDWLHSSMNRRLKMLLQHLRSISVAVRCMRRGRRTGLSDAPLFTAGSPRHILLAKFFRIRHEPLKPFRRLRCIRGVGAIWAPRSLRIDTLFQVVPSMMFLRPSLIHQRIAGSYCAQRQRSLAGNSPALPLRL